MTDNSKQQRDYRETLVLPKTDFPMRAGLPKREPEWVERWQKLDIYGQLRKQSKGREQFSYHDGPPYANGHVHLGTALNKILKDFVVRSHQMMGYDTAFVPGWDCHGLPIEWKVEEGYRKKGRSKDEVPINEFRAECRAYAQHWLDIQREEFKRLGVFADWDNPYTTMAFSSEARIVSEFLKFAMSGNLYRGSKPVMWSPVEQTALAEAEVEYADHVSTAIWVRFPVTGGEHEDASVLIWTTTPWTIPANRAICFNPKISYGLYEVTAIDDSDFTPWSVVGEKLIVADSLWEAVAKTAKISGSKRLGDVNPKTLTCAHPFAGEGYDFAVPMLQGDHVTEEAGTGFVHTAPGHGADDYDVWLANGYREIPETVGPDGVYYDDVPLFAGLDVIRTTGKKTGQDGKANPAVLAKLLEVGALLARGRIKHSYPHSWRSKAPIIFRNTPQWFIPMGDDKGEDGLRAKALAALETVEFFPPRGANRIGAMVKSRPDWLVSRQRAWGVPLTLFVKKGTGEYLQDEAVNARIIKAVSEQGVEAWSEISTTEFLGDNYDPDEFEKITDILDVWFDSGCSHAFTLEDRPDLSWPADVYLEGSDQHRGWFQSSLLESCANYGEAPYDAVLTHGFVVDEKGIKMSKSLGNTIAPEQIIRQYGADILRLWVASSDFTDDLRIGDEIIKTAADAYRKLRNTLRYMVGALDGYDSVDEVAYDDMPALEKWVLHRLSELDVVVKDAYKKHDFKKVYSALFNFCTNDLSAFYFDVRK
ncbi:MAG: isoleucine--tRNA ligase, partial [Robiginitomaculum sp.]|nr:isoleucine--tRNA ligase [Robiginitomaculum sp.]